MHGHTIVLLPVLAKSLSRLLAVSCLLLVNSLGAFDFQEELFGEPGTLSAFVQDLDPDTGQVVVNGVDSAQPNTPFDVDWDDGSPVEAVWFPFSHNYADTSKNYIATLTAHYDDGGTDDVNISVRFIAPALNPIALPMARKVIIDNTQFTLESRPYPGYGIPTLTYFDDNFFVVVPRSSIEYVLHLAAELQHSFANGDVLEVSGGFQQHVLRGAAGGGMYSLWYTDPVAFGAGDYAFSGTPQYSSFFHEMGHNLSLNSPAAYHFGGRIDGNANAIYSETMAQIFAHATSYVLLNDHAGYGLEDTLALEIELSAQSSMQLVSNTYRSFVDAGAPFTSWNLPGTPSDETFGTFMTLAYKFFEHAENAGNDYTVPLQRMMRLLQLFNADMAASYARHLNTVEAETYRSTLMVAALSYAFDSDLREEMRALNFPIDDVIHQQLIEATGCLADLSLNCPFSGDPQSYIDGLNLQLNGVVSAPDPCPEVARVEWDWGDGEFNDSWFPAAHTYSEPGEYVIFARGIDDSGSILAEDFCDINFDVIFKNGFE